MEFENGVYLGGGDPSFGKLKNKNKSHIFKLYLNLKCSSQFILT